MNDEFLGDELLALEDDEPPHAPPAPLVKFGVPPHQAELSPSWPPRLAFDLALGLDTEETILDRHFISPQQWDTLRTNPGFLKELVEQKRSMMENGVTFRAKARIQAEEYLLVLDRLATSPNIDPKVQLEAIRSIVKWAGLEPKEEKGEAASQQNIQININI